MGLRVTWTIPMYVFEHAVKNGRDRFEQELEFEMGEAARRIESYARGNHVWENRTGDAEREFTVQYDHGARKMIMEHGVPYGVYLENMQGGRFGIIPSTFAHGKPLVQEGLQRSLDKAFSW